MSWLDDPYADRDYASAPVKGHYQQHPLQEAKTAIRFVAQGKHWADANNAKILIEDMDTDYVFSTMAHLLKRAATLKLAIELYYKKNGAPAELVERLEKMSSEQFMRQTVLFQSLMKRFISEPEIPDMFGENSEDD